MMKFISFTLVVFFILGAPTQAMETSSKQAIIIDMGTGMVLLDKNADSKMPTSSMSKVMTAYMVFDALKNGTISMNTLMPVSEKAWKKGGSKMFVEVGKKVSVEDLLKGVIVQSGNDATIVLAEGIAGDEDAFAMAMTKVANDRLDMKASNFKNASGWPDPDHYSTARDLAKLAQRIIVDFPHYYSLYSLKEFTFNGITQANRNPLLYRNMGGDGIKTGHTEAGGYGLIASGEKNGRRVVMVVNGLTSGKDRADESARLMGWALNGFENKTLVKTGAVLANADTVFADVDTVGLAVSRDIRVTVPNAEKKNVTMNARFDSPIAAPIQKGDQLGELIVSVPQIGDFSVPLVAANDVNEAGFFGRSVDIFKYLFWE
jgi:D-alanyl-D-alanine carboxypeptidase (penicillin-binding protein 5/6)